MAGRTIMLPGMKDKPETVSLTIKVSPQIRRDLKIISASQGRTMNEIAESMLLKGIQAHQQLLPAQT